MCPCPVHMLRSGVRSCGHSFHIHPPPRLLTAGSRVAVIVQTNKLNYAWNFTPNIAIYNTLTLFGLQGWTVSRKFPLNLKISEYSFYEVWFFTPSHTHSRLLWDNRYSGWYRSWVYMFWNSCSHKILSFAYFYSVVWPCRGSRMVLPVGWTGTFDLCRTAACSWGKLMSRAGPRSWHKAGIHYLKNPD